MTRWVTENFGGIAPKVHPKKLSDELAVNATNVSFDDARLAPLNGIAFDQDLGTANTQSLHYYEGQWIASQNDRRYVESLLPNDVDEKIFFSDYPNYPKMQSGGSTYRLGLPKPGTPSAVIDAPGDEDPTLAETWIYVCAFVDAFGFEGPTSAPSNVTVVGSGGSTTVTFTGAPTGNYNLASGAVLRVYRSNDGTQASAFQFLTDLPIGTLTFDDDIASASLEEVLTTNDNYPAPDENSPYGSLRGLVELPGGILAGYTNNTVHLSKPLQPHAWPYEFATQDKIVGIVPVLSGLFVATEAKPYMLVGSEPANMNIQPLLSNQACINEHSLVDMGGYALFASPDGLCSIDGNTVTVLTRDLITPRQWLSTFNPTTIRAFNYEGTYVAFDDTGAGFSFNYADGTNALKRYTGEVINAAYRDPLSDKLYVMYEQNNNEVLGTWNEGTPRTYTWTSKVKQHSKTVAFTYLKLYGDAGEADVTVWADGRAYYLTHVEINQLIRIPVEGKASDWQFSIRANKGINLVGLYTSRGEVL